MHVQSVADSELIDFVKFSKANPVVGDPISVSPVLNYDHCGEDTMVSINGVPGATQTLQFSSSGQKRIHVAAFTMEDGRKRVVDQQSITVEVGENTESKGCRSFQPIVHARQVPQEGLTVVFRIENVEDFEAEEPTYRWEIDGETERVTQSPRFQYDFSDDLEADAPFTTFEISVQARSEDGIGSAIGQRSVSVWNINYINRRQGVVELETVSRPELIRDGDRYTVSYELRNPGNMTVEVDTQQLEFLTVDNAEPRSEFLVAPGTKTAPLREPKSESFSISPSESVVREFDLPVGEAPDGMFGIGLHFFGRTVSEMEEFGVSAKGPEGDVDVPAEEKEMEAFGNVYAELRRGHPLARPILNPDLVDILDNIDARLPDGLEKTPVELPELIGNDGDQFDGCSLKGAPTSAGSAGTPDKSKILNTLPGTSAPMSDSENGEEKEWVAMSGEAGVEIPDSDDATEGDPCLSYQDPPEEGLACQLTDEYRYVYIPGRILNARKGDIIISPGSGSAIAELLMKVDPMEVYSHSGIMTNDHLELRHSTGSVEWLKDQKEGEVLDQKGTEGLDPSALKYVWPGAITQKIDEAFQGSGFEDPSGTKREISAFTSEITSGSSTGVVWPEVVKPDPRLEHRISELRSLLNEVADNAAEVEAHYRFYAYTDASIFFDPEYIPDDPVDEWWVGTKPTVCTSLIWGAAKSLEDSPQLEMDAPPLTNRDLERDDRGAKVHKDTEEGLYFYTEDERKTAAQWLYDHFYNIAYQKLKESEIPAWAAEAATNAAGDLANQITNTFAFDWAGTNDDGKHAKDSHKWEDPGSGNAVSPDTIRNYWDAPSEENGQIQGLYGHSEKLVYRPGRVEKRRVRRWKRVEPEEATLKVDVSYEGSRLGHATVEVGGESGITDEDGNFQTSLPPGSYTVHAHKNQDGWYLSKQKEVQLDPGETETLSITLEDPPEMYRLIEASGTVEVLDDDWFNNPRDKMAFLGHFARVGPHQKTATISWSHKVGGEVRGKVKINLEWQPDGDVKADVWMGLFQNGDKEKDTSVSLVVPKDDGGRFTGELKSGGIDNPHAWFYGTLRNQQAPV